MGEDKPTAEVMTNFVQHLDNYRDALREVSRAHTARSLAGFGVLHTDPREIAAMKRVSAAYARCSSIKASLIASWKELPEAQQRPLITQLSPSERDLLIKITQRNGNAT